MTRLPSPRSRVGSALRISFVAPRRPWWKMNPCTLSLESRVQRKPDVPWKELDGTIVVLDLTGGDFFELDEVGARIWMALDGARSLREVASVLAREYDAPVEQIASDVMGFVADLESRALVATV